MARYPSFLGRSVEVQYRAGDILLPASGTFVADSGRSIFLEQHIEQRGQIKQFRWEIPYQCIVRIREKEDAAPAAAAPTARDSDAPSEADTARQSAAEEDPPAQASAACASGGASALQPLNIPPKTA